MFNSEWSNLKEDRTMYHTLPPFSSSRYQLTFISRPLEVFYLTIKSDSFAKVTSQRAIARKIYQDRQRKMFSVKIIILCLCSLTFANCLATNFNLSEDSDENELLITTKLPLEVQNFELKLADKETPEAVMEFELSGESGDHIETTADYESVTFESETELTTLYVDENSTTLVFLEDLETVEVISETQDESFLQTTMTDESGYGSTTEAVSLYNDDEDSFDESSFDSTASTTHPIPSKEGTIKEFSTY